LATQVSTQEYQIHSVYLPHCNVTQLYLKNGFQAWKNIHVLLNAMLVLVDTGCWKRIQRREN
jgi:hypothetical protein